MKTIVKPVGTRDIPVMGEISFPVFESIDEAITAYGPVEVLTLINKGIAPILERIARESLRKHGKQAEAQKAVDEYKPGVTAVKPSLKNFTRLAGEFAAAGNFDALSEAYEIYNNENIEAAFNFLREKKDAGQLVG